MTTRSITEQVNTIKRATETAASSKEAAIAFLRKAGIIVKAFAFDPNSQKENSRWVLSNGVGMFVQPKSIRFKGGWSPKSQVVKVDKTLAASVAKNPTRKK